jgi:hypothetical protein
MPRPQDSATRGRKSPDGGWAFRPRPEGAAAPGGSV